jgi:arsenite methyltransferase
VAWPSKCERLKSRTEEANIRLTCPGAPSADSCSFRRIWRWEKWPRSRNYSKTSEAMNHEGSCRVYERISATDLAVNGIRPGGFEITERALAHCRFPVNSRILDVGCGTGVTLDRLINTHEFSAVGADASHVILEQGRAGNPALPLVRAVGESLPFPDACMDAILAECSLSVIAYPDNALAEFHRVLKESAGLILTDVYARNPAGVERLARMPVECCLRGAVSREEVMERLSGSGFTIDLWEDHSDRLMEFAVNVIFSYGSMERFWLGAASESVDPEEMRQAISGAKPGYFLIIARKVSASKGNKKAAHNDG